jgi:hypothetical protein
MLTASGTAPHGGFLPVGPGLVRGTILSPMTTPAPRCPTCGGVLGRDQHSILAPGERLTPWMLHDLPRIAWIVEYRAAELTDEERQLVREATDRMRRALDSGA